MLALGKRQLSAKASRLHSSTFGRQISSFACLATTQESPASSTHLDGTRGVLRLAGSDLFHFLQGLLTNDISSLHSPSTRPVYAALLNAQGRQLHDLFLYRAPGDEPIILADVDKDGLGDLKRKLTMYKLRSHVDIADVSDSYSVWVRFGLGEPPSGDWPMDPRLDALGQRAVLARDAAPHGQPVSSSADYRQWRIEHGVAEGDTEMPSGHAMPLEYNLDALNGVSYSKGCYVGQELVARTHNRGVVRKRLMPVSITGSAPESDAAILPDSGGTECGIFRLVEGSRGLAHLRLKPALESIRGSLQLTSGEAKVLPWRPRWWPDEWGNEEAATQAAQM